jgi:hypothetical protein
VRVNLCAQATACVFVCGTKLRMGLCFVRMNHAQAHLLELACTLKSACECLCAHVCLFLRMHLFVRACVPFRVHVCMRADASRLNQRICTSARACICVRARHFYTFLCGCLQVLQWLTL